METKKLKKLILKKDVVSKLENEEMKQVKGGTGTTTSQWLSLVEPCVFSNAYQCGDSNDCGGDTGDTWTAWTRALCTETMELSRCMCY